MFGKVIVGLGPSVRAIGTAGVLWALVAGSVGTAGATTTLQNLFADADDLDADSDGAFTQDGLTFSDFTPLLRSKDAPGYPSLQDVRDTVLPATDPISVGNMLVNLVTNPDFVTQTIQDNPAAVSFFNTEFLDLSDNAVFSVAWGNANPALAGNIDLTILPDAPGGGIDPGFSLDGGSQWQVEAGNLASLQLSAFAYTVTREPQSQLITSADLVQSSEITAADVGPDSFSFFPFELPDVAGGFTFQFVLDDPDPDSADLSQSLMNYTLDSGVRLFNEVFLPPSNRKSDWEQFAGREAIRVVSVIGVGASSGGQFAIDTLSQRIDPPPPGVPEPETGLLLLLGMLGIGALRRRVG